MPEVKPWRKPSTVIPWYSKKENEMEGEERKARRCSRNESKPLSVYHVNLKKPTDVKSYKYINCASKPQRNLLEDG